MIARSEQRQRLIEHHRYLCTRAARKFLRKGVDRADLEQVAAIGLIKAADRFDTEAGTPFEAYAWRFVLGELMHYVRDCERVLRAPRRLLELERRWVAAERELPSLLGREPSDGEVADFIGASHDEASEIRRYRDTRLVLSTDALRPFEHRSLSYTIEQQLDRVLIDNALGRLTPLEREILVEIYERDTPLLELAERLGYSRRHLTRLHRGALDKLSPYARPQSA
ncbi:MAG TPA: sigma-70 family RNA polymerase sigma factor [Candidatus Baltobacteraceae bacterium]|nr:sigma-70 family RNA polymerase sigma factor [Candidatus Baltobacteraceae bacterium]